VPHIILSVWHGEERPAVLSTEVWSRGEAAHILRDD